MAKITLSKPLSGFNLSAINENFSAIEAEFQDKVLYRNNSTGETNTLESDLDANSKRIYNLPAPMFPTEAVRLQDVQDIIAITAPANLTGFSPAGGISSTNVQDAIEELDGEKLSSNLLVSSSGASLVGANPNQTQDEVNNEKVSVKAYGAKGDGVFDDTLSFGVAARSAPATVNIIGAEGLLPRAPSCFVTIPAGSYVLSSEVDTGGREVTWQADAAAVISGYQFLNGKLLRPGQSSVDYHHGTTDYSCTYSIRTNGNEDGQSEVTGITLASQLSTYSDRDSVSLYIDNQPQPALVVAVTAVYTSTTVTVPVQTSATVKRYRRGMIIDTSHATKWSGMVSSWNSDGSVITVTGWYEYGMGGAAGTPTGTAGCVLNGITKVWAQNSNVFLNPTGYATSATGYELGLLNSKGASSANYSDAVNRCWGYDSVNLGTYAGQAAYIARGAWHHGFYARGQGTGFTYDGTGLAYIGKDANGVVFYSVDATGNLILGPASIANTKTVKFNSSGVSTDYDVAMRVTGGSATIGQGTLELLAATTLFSGSLRPTVNATQNFGSPSQRLASVYATALDATASVSLGPTASATTPFIDFNSSGNNIDYDVRILASGGTGVAGNGALTITAGAGTKFAGVINPNQDNLITCGIPAFRWSTIYAGTGTINTSDEREKTFSSITESEILVAKELKMVLGKFKFNDAIAAKGEAAARIHFGIGAQTVVSIFTSHGLDATKYALLCYDEWSATDEQVDVDGKVIQSAAPAGNRYGIRYEELLAFIISAM